MYGLAGERDLQEYTLPWLAGYEHSQPVRVGNAASAQTQLDIYGELADAMSQAIRGGLPRHPRSAAIARLILPYLESIWRDSDEGIWEVRGGRQHFVHSKVMAWVAFDRAAGLAETTEEGREQARHYRQVADQIHQEVCEQGLDAGGSHFVQAYGSAEMDASLLHIALTGFLPAEDPRFLRTLEQIEQRLLKNGLLLRYDTDSCGDDEQTKAVGVRQHLRVFIAVLAHLLSCIFDLVAYLLVHLLDVGQCIQRPQAYHQAKQRRGSIQHQVFVTTTQLEIGVGCVARRYGLAGRSGVMGFSALRC